MKSIGKNQMHTLMTSLAALALVFSLFSLFMVLYQQDNKYVAGAPYGEDGVFAFTEDDLAASRPLFLIDGWELYPDKQYTPKDFATPTPPEPPEHTFIGQYPNFSYVSANHSPFGEATYRLLLRSMGEPRILTLEIPEIFTDYTLWVDGKQAATRGSGGSYTFLLDGEAELMLGVENHTHYYSGLTYPPALGKPKTIERMFLCRMAFYGTLAVCTLTLAVFSSVLWLSRKRDSLFLHFGLLCVCFFVTCLHPFIWRAGLSAALWYALEDTARLALLFQTAAICSIVSGLSVSRWYRRVRHVTIGLCALCPIFVILIIPHFGGIINFYGRALELCELLCWGYLCVCAAKGLRERTAGSRFILVAGAVLGASFFVNLADNGRFEPIYTGWQSEYAGFLLVLVFGGLMIARNREILAKNEQLIFRMEELVQQRTAELHRVLEERKSFFSDMAHNLKAPIAAVHAFVSLIKDGNLYLDEELRGYLRQIECENVEMRQRVQALSTLNAFDRIHSPTEAIDVGELLEQVRRGNAPEAEASGIYFEVGALEQHATIKGQREKLLTLFENLIYNALSFTPMEGRICILPSIEDSEVVIEVCDTGSGIAPEHLPHIFERFYVGRENKNEGSGLGLYIAKLTVEELGGSITAASVLGERTVFTIRLPLKSTLE